jgi:XTP/dITP diphosphohydrolase
MQLVFATNNKHKLEEIQNLLNGIYVIKSLKDLNIVEDIPETHETLEENAIEKANYIYHKFGVDCFADDTGLEIDALGGRPGVYSARYAGPTCNFDDNVNKILFELQKITNRNARFRTVIALILKGEVFTFEGVVQGKIIKEKKGRFGFGYDPVFVPDGFSITFAEMELLKKNKISHRARAIEKFTAFLNAKFNG